MNKVSTMHRVQSRRSQRVRSAGSPIGNTTLGVITAGLDSVLAAGNAGTVPGANMMNDLRKYFPLNFIEVTNGSAQALALRLNGDLVGVLPAGTIKTFTRNNFTHIALRNTGVVDTVTGTVSVIVQKMPLDADQAARERG